MRHIKVIWTARRRLGTDGLAVVFAAKMPLYTLNNIISKATMRRKAERNLRSAKRHRTVPLLAREKTIGETMMTESGA